MKAMAGLLLLGALVQQGREEGPRLPAEKVERLFGLVKASPGEARWDEIAWTTSLWEGRKKAAAEGKPLFIWAANGNPLGMT